MGHTCRTCPFADLGNEDDHNETVCRATPPVVVSEIKNSRVLRWAPIDPDKDWCGEHPEISRAVRNQAVADTLRRMHLAGGDPEDQPPTIGHPSRPEESDRLGGLPRPILQLVKRVAASWGGSGIQAYMGGETTIMEGKKGWAVVIHTNDPETEEAASMLRNDLFHLMGMLKQGYLREEKDPATPESDGA